MATTITATTNGDDDDDDTADATSNGHRQTKKPRLIASASCWPDDATVKAACWKHYRDYLDSCNDEDEMGDIDELHEILAKCGCQDDDLAVLPAPDHWMLTENMAPTTNDDDAVFWPVLFSVVHGILADYAISQHLQSAGADNNNTILPESPIRKHLTASLTACPVNATVWSMAANLARMQQHSAAAGSSNHPLTTVAAAYERAIQAAVQVRRTAIQWLEQEQSEEQQQQPNDDGDNKVAVPVKEWIELLLLNQIAGVEWTDDDDEEEKEEEETESADGGCWSESSVEATARFMLAMLQSTLGQHDAALEQLQAFPKLTHRLHPNLWQQQQQETTAASSMEESNSNKSTTISPPMVFKGGVLPQPLYERLLEVFAPGAAYWTESNYDHRGYYSYFMDLQQQQQPKDDNGNNSNDYYYPAHNLLEDVIFNHLLPLARQKLSKPDADSICGAEWWVHTRPIQANLGHNLHFDTDEALLEQDQNITHPILSSVLYLTGDAQGGGATVVLDQTPHSNENAKHAWVSVPSDNSYLLFPGDRLHGVLPCKGKTAPTTKNGDDKAVTATTTTTTQQAVQLSDLFPTTTAAQQDPDASAEEEEQQPLSHRLTFMVGFWTRRVPDRIKGGAKLYGPCGPLPPCTDEHSWVRTIMEGYDNNSSSSSNDATMAKTPPATRTEGLQEMPVPVVAPAWEVLPKRQQDEEGNKTDVKPNLELPRGMIDHRFFVEGAPRCFYDALFERDDDEGAEEDNPGDDCE